MDREADSYEIFDCLVSAGRRFVIRLMHNRILAGGESRLFDELNQVEGIAEREVHLGHRKRHSAPSHRKIHPPRAARMAKLAFAATTICLPRPSYLGSMAHQLKLNVVRVFELDTPVGSEPVEWRLVTTEPIDTVEQVLAIVDFYRKRWVIEEFFKALKTGCAVEKRQLESLAGLLSMLALFIPAAWNLLRLRVLARDAAETPADQILTPTQLAILRTFPRARIRLGACPTVRNALLAIAALGGHLARNGEPGWITLHRGYDELLTLERGWQIALSTERCDQS
jgi:IS4 transposase